MTRAEPAERSRGALIAYVCASLLVAVALPWWGRLLLAVELVAIAALLRRSSVAPRLTRWAAACAVLRLAIVAPLVARRNEQVDLLVSLASAHLGELPTVEMATTASRELLAVVPLSAGVALVLSVLLAIWTSTSARQGWHAPMVAAVLVPVIALADRPLREDSEPRGAAPEELYRNVGLRALQIPDEAVTTAAPPGELPPEGRWDEVVLVVLESVGAHNLQQHLARHPEGPFAGLWRSGLRFERVVAASNVSHMAQPALLTSQEFTRYPGRHTVFPPGARAAWSFPAHFAAKGWTTHFESSQDETWLGMQEITLDQPWTRARHALDLPAEATYRDACGVRKAFDSGTVARVAALLDRLEGPSFVTVNLQNTHFPFVVEGDPDATGRGFACGDFLDMPEDKLDAASRRYSLAVDATLQRVAELVGRRPEALWVVTGDHAENMVPGRAFGHSKFAIPEETDSFALLVGPGIEGGSVATTVSALDLLPTVAGLVRGEDRRLLPAGLLQGVDRFAADTDRISFTTSYGLGDPQYAAADDEARLHVGWWGRVCTGDESRCAVLAEALAFWISCKTVFHGETRDPDAFESCTAVARAGRGEGRVRAR